MAGDSEGDVLPGTWGRGTDVRAAFPDYRPLPVLPVRGFTADTPACRALVEHRRACEEAKRKRAAGVCLCILFPAPTPQLDGD